MNHGREYCRKIDQYREEQEKQYIEYNIGININDMAINIGYNSKRQVPL